MWEVYHEQGIQHSEPADCKAQPLGPVRRCVPDGHVRHWARQTSKFTAQFGTALSLVIVLAIIMDITAQMNIWSVVSVSGMRA